MPESDEGSINGYEPIVHSFAQAEKGPPKRKEKKKTREHRMPMYTFFEGKDGKVIDHRLNSVLSEHEDHAPKQEFHLSEKWEPYFSPSPKDTDTLSASGMDTTAMFETTVAAESSLTVAPKVGSRDKLRADFPYWIENATHTFTMNPGDLNAYFVGFCTAKEAADKLEDKMDFLIYYQLPSLKNEIPSTIPLTLAYRSSTNKYFHFPIVTIKNDTMEMWYVKYGDPNVQKFSSLESLVHYYTIFSLVDPKTQRMETFPVWKGVVVDSF